MTDLGGCEQEVRIPADWRKVRCLRKAKETVHGRKLCTQHAKIERNRFYRYSGGRSQ